MFEILGYLVYNVSYRDWYAFDDVDVEPIQSREVNSAAAFILFYRAVGFDD